MAKKEPGTIHLDLPASPISPGSNGLALPSTSLTRNGRQPTREEQYIGTKLRTDLAIQLGMAIKGEHANRLTHTLSVRSMIHFDEFITEDRAIREKPRAYADDQADMELFCGTMRQAQANSLLAIRQGAVNRIEEAVLTSLDPPAEQDDIIIEQRPGLLGKLLGGQVTRVRR